MAETAQVVQMTHFILNEAKDKAEEIGAKALQEFNVEKQRVLNNLKEKLDQDYARKLKQLETQHAIARSTAINRSRLTKIRARQEMVGKVGEDTKAALQQELRDQGKLKTFTTKLITQGLLMLLEEEVQVRCRASDVGLVQSCLGDAASSYTRAVKDNTGVAKQVKLSIDQQKSLPPAPTAQGGPSCLGGIMLACQGGNITIDNTIDSRMGLVMEQAKPMIRQLLFNA